MIVSTRSIINIGTNTPASQEFPTAGCVYALPKTKCGLPAVYSICIICRYWTLVPYNLPIKRTDSNIPTRLHYTAINLLLVNH